MLISYGSPAYLLYLLLAAGLVAATYYGLKNRSAFTQDAVLFSLAVINVIQHFFKPFVWPHLYGTEFSHIQTAYNVCACLILATPLAYLLRVKFFRQFLFSVGTVAGVLPLLIPYWFIGQTPFQWEFARSFVCHILLFITSLMPLLLNKYRWEEANAPFIPLHFFCMLAVIFVNDVVCIRAGIVAGVDAPLWEAMQSLNPMWIMGPSPAFPAIGKFLAGFSYGVKCGPLPCVPVLWYFIPLSFLIYMLAGLLGRLSDRYYEKKKRFLPKFYRNRIKISQ